MKEFKFENINPRQDLEIKLWNAVNLIREYVSLNDFHIILYLLVLKRDGLFRESSFSNDTRYKQQIQDYISRYEGAYGEALRRLYQIYQPIIDAISDGAMNEFIHFLRSVNQGVLMDHFCEIFDDILFKYIKWQGKSYGGHIEPIELSRFIWGLSDLPPDANAYNPFAGLASFGVFLDPGTEYLGQESNQTAWAIGSLRIMAYQRSGVSNFIQSDPINYWNYNKDKYDLIISNPPLGMRLPQDIDGKFGSIRTYEHFLIEKGIEDLKPSGKLITLVPNRFLSNLGTEQNLRRFLVENDLLEMVISFPGGMLMNTGIPFSILVTNKNKKEKSSVRFIDAKRFIDNSVGKEKKLNDYALNSIIKSNKESESIRFVPNSEINEFDYNLNVPRYFAPEVNIDINENLEKLEELVSVIRGQRYIEGQVGKFIRIRELKEDKLDYELDPKIIEQVAIPRPALKISESCLLLASRWKSLKPTFFHYTGESIFILPDIFALRVDETKIDINFIINELHARYITEQIESYRIGVVIPYLRKDDLLRIKIKLPSYHKQKKYVESIREQRSKVKGATEAIFDEKKKETELFKKIHGIEIEMLEQNAYLRHTLAGSSTNLKGSIESLKKIIEDHIIPIVPDVMNFKVSTAHTLNLQTYLEIMERDILKIVKTTSRVIDSNNQVQGKDLSPVNISDFLYNYCAEKSGTNALFYELKFECTYEELIDGEGNKPEILIMANKELLADLFDNLIQNAEQHAFPGSSNNRIEICLMLPLEEEKDSFEKISLLISNTGKGFPEDFMKKEFIRRGATAGENAGDGFGGWYINEIIKYFKGELDIIGGTGAERLSGTDLATSFEINIPISQINSDESI